LRNRDRERAESEQNVHPRRSDIEERGSVGTVSKTWSAHIAFGVANTCFAVSLHDVHKTSVSGTFDLQQLRSSGEIVRTALKTITVEPVITYAGCRRFALMIGIAIASLRKEGRRSRQTTILRNVSPIAWEKDIKSMPLLHPRQRAESGHL
jgi:hypothetical protein